MIPISYNVRSLLVRKTTTIASALGIGLVVYVLASSQMLANGIKKTMGSSGSVDKAFLIRKGSDNELSSGIETGPVGIALAGPGVKRSADGKPLGVGELMLVLTLVRVGGTGSDVSNVQLRGVSQGSFDVRPDVRVIEGRPAKPGTDEVIIGRRIDGKFNGVTVGQSFEIKKNRRVQVVGVFEAGGSQFESEVWADIDTVRAAFGREGLVSSMTVQLESASKLEGYKAAIESDKQLNLQVETERGYFERQSENTAGLVKYLGIGIVVFFSVGAMIGAMITMYGAVAGRLREIGTLRALGFSRLNILTSFLIESLMLALVGGILGGLAALAMGTVEFSMMNMQTFSEVVFSFDPDPGILFFAIAMGGLMGIIGGFLPAVRAARTSPIDAMREG
jgi:putative ABC transport system permease protein